METRNLAKELRIGNLVLDSTGNIHKIERLDEKWDFSDRKPIPLTEEWFLKSGFEFDTVDWQFSYPSCYFIGWYAGKWCLGTQSDGVLKETYFEHVHQLQNLYFALTGEELEINLTQEQL